MITVYNKNELQKALEAKEKHIIIKGELAKTIKAKAKRKKTLKKVGIGTAAVGAAAIIAAPFTGGTSLAAGAATMGLTATVGGAALTISMGELALIIGGSLALAGILKGYDDVKFNSDGSVELHHK